MYKRQGLLRQVWRLVLNLTIDHNATIAPSLDDLVNFCTSDVNVTRTIAADRAAIKAVVLPLHAAAMIGARDLAM